MKKSLASKNKSAEEICGKRPDGIPIDQPSELEYYCPENRGHEIHWSEYNYFIWCFDCNKDYPSIICCDTKKGIEVFLEVTRHIKDVAYEAAYNIGYEEGQKSIPTSLRYTGECCERGAVFLK